MTTESIDRDSEAWELMMRLVHGFAENYRLDAEKLLDAGFEVVQVRGLPDVLWKQNGGPHDGALFTTEAAIRVVEPPETIPDPREG